MDTIINKLIAFVVIFGLLLLWVSVMTAWKASGRWYHFPRELAKCVGVLLMGMGVFIGLAIGTISFIIAIVSLFTMPIAALPAGLVFCLVLVAIAASGQKTSQVSNH